MIIAFALEVINPSSSFVREQKNSSTLYKKNINTHSLETKSNKALSHHSSQKNFMNDIANENGDDDNNNDDYTVCSAIPPIRYDLNFLTKIEPFSSEEINIPGFKNIKLINRPPLDPLFLS